MATRVTNLKVFVASPGDVSDERSLVEEVVRELNKTLCPHLEVRLELVMWETDAYPGVGSDPQAVINEQIADDYDIFVGILWSRFGTPTRRAGSGTEEEFQRAYEKYKANPSQVRIMCYFSEAMAKVSSLDPEQLAAVKKFQRQLGEKGVLYWSYEGVEEFGKFLRLHLSQQVKEYRTKWGQRSTTVEGTGMECSEAVRATEEEEGLGIIELIERGMDSAKGLGAAADALTKTVQAFLAKIEQRAAEFSNRGRVADVKIAKKLCNILGKDLDLFAKRLNSHIPNFDETYSSTLDSFSQASAMLQEDLGQHVFTKLAGDLADIEVLCALLARAAPAVREFQGKVATIPRGTTSLRRARKNLMEVLELLAMSFDKALTLARDVKAMLLQLQSNASPTDAQADEDPGGPLVRRETEASDGAQ